MFFLGFRGNRMKRFVFQIVFVVVCMAVYSSWHGGLAGILGVVEHELLWIRISWSHRLANVQVCPWRF